MSENINEVLNVSMDTEIEKKDELSLGEEKTLRTIADIVLIVGIISSFILFLRLHLSECQTIDQNLVLLVLFIQ